MRKPLMFLIIASMFVVVATFWSIDATVVVGGKEMVGLFRPQALPLLYGALALFAIALVFAIRAAVRAWMHPAAPPETPAPPAENAPATN